MPTSRISRQANWRDRDDPKYSTKVQASSNYIVIEVNIHIIKIQLLEGTAFVHHMHIYPLGV